MNSSIFFFVFLKSSYLILKRVLRYYVAHLDQYIFAYVALKNRLFDFMLLFLARFVSFIILDVCFWIVLFGASQLMLL